MLYYNLPYVYFIFDILISGHSRSEDKTPYYTNSNFNKYNSQTKLWSAISINLKQKQFFITRKKQHLHFETSIFQKIEQKKAKKTQETSSTLPLVIN